MNKLTNPNLLYILTFSVPFLVYSLQWSTLYPALQFNLILFYALTFAACIGLSIVFSLNRKKIEYHTISASGNNVLVLVLLYVFYLADITYTGYLPLYSFSTGHANYTGSIEYGIPVLHVIAVTFNLFYALYVFHQYLSNKRNYYLLIYFLLIVPFIALLQRSNIMYILVGSGFEYVLSLRRIIISKVIYILVAVVMSLYVFGYLGNLRSANGDSTYIPRSSGATDGFMKGPIPNEFYWGYLYIGSPLANLQNNINLAKEPTVDYTGLFINELAPDFVGKRVSKGLFLQYRAFIQINPYLNVGTIYARPFNYARWPGVITVFTIFILLMNIYCVIISRSFTYGVTGLAMVFVAIAFANFENTISFSAYSFQLIYPLILSGVKKYKQQSALKWQLSR